MSLLVCFPAAGKTCSHKRIPDHRIKVGNQTLGAKIRKQPPSPTGMSVWQKEKPMATQQLIIREEK